MVTGEGLTPDNIIPDKSRRTLRSRNNSDDDIEVRVISESNVPSNIPDAKMELARLQAEKSNESNDKDVDVQVDEPTREKVDHREGRVDMSVQEIEKAAIPTKEEDESRIKALLRRIKEGLLD